MKPQGPPLGLQLATTAKTVGRAFNDALAAAGGSIASFRILNALTSEERRTQLELARAVGIEGPTLTRHLDGLEQARLVERRRDPDDRRAIQVRLTESGEALHARLLQAVIAFNRQLRAGLEEPEIEQLRATLDRLQANVRR